MTKIKMASEVISALVFLGISTENFKQLRQKHTLVGLHNRLGQILRGENIIL